MRQELTQMTEEVTKSQALKWAKNQVRGAVEAQEGTRHY